MFELDPQKRPKRATWIAIGVFAVLAFFVSAALPGGAAPSGEEAGDTAAPAAGADAGDAADATAPKRPLQAPRAPSPFPAGRAVMSLLAVLVLIVVAAFGASRWLRRMRIRPGGDRVLDVVDAVPLGPKRQVYVVSAYGRRLVIGASGDNLCLLSEIDEEETGETPPVSFDDRVQSRLRPVGGALEAEA